MPVASSEARFQVKISVGEKVPSQDLAGMINI